MASPPKPDPKPGAPALPALARRFRAAPGDDDILLAAATDQPGTA